MYSVSESVIGFFAPVKWSSDVCSSDLGCAQSYPGIGIHNAVNREDACQSGFEL